MTEAAIVRARIAEAIEARTAAEEVLDRAIGALDNGEKLERSAQAEYDALGDLDRRIADCRAARFVGWAQDGVGPRPELSDIPPELAEAERLRTEARLTLSTAIDATILLRRNANAAQADFTGAKDRVVYAARQNLDVDGWALAARIEETKRELWRLEDRAASLLLLWPGGSQLSSAPAIDVALNLNRKRHDADRRPNQPFRREHFLALWREYFARLLDDAGAEWQWRPPRPEDHTTVNPFLNRTAQFNFVPPSLAAFRRLAAEAERAEPEPLPPFIGAQAELASQAHRRQLAALEAEREANAEAAARRAVEG
jgi:hypothetical protein